MSETFKSQALEANLAQTRYKDIFIPEEHQQFIALSAKYFGINKRAKECITEYHHPLSNHTFVTEELRKMLLDDFWFYSRDDIPADALHIPLENILFRSSGSVVCTETLTVMCMRMMRSTSSSVRLVSVI